MGRIIGISGRKQAGKSTTANYISGNILLSKELVKSFHIDSGGNLVIKTTGDDGNTQVGIFDVARRDRTFVDYAEKHMWPFVKVYHFADTLKSIAIELFGLDPRQVFGTNDDKNSDTRYTWEGMPTNPNGKTGVLSARDFLQYFGTALVRQIADDAWVHATIKRVKLEDSEVALIPDVRFPNEVLAIKEAGGVVIRMERDPFNDDHPCESALDRGVFDWDNFDHIVPNTATTIEQLIAELDKLSHLWR